MTTFFLDLFSFIDEYLPFFFLISCLLALVETYKKYKNGDFR